MSNFDEERMCRLNGKKPTMRECWTAFYRLYRLSHGHGANQDMEATDCMRILWKNWSWFRLIETNVPSVSRVGWPVFLRRRFLKMDERRRLHGQYLEWLERDQSVSRQMCAEGTEMTPLEVARVRVKTLKMVREKAAEIGCDLPMDDEDLLRWLKKAQ